MFLEDWRLGYLSLWVVVLRVSRAGVPKVVDIDPQGSMGASKGSMNMQGVERGSMNN